MSNWWDAYPTAPRTEMPAQAPGIVSPPPGLQEAVTEEAQAGAKAAVALQNSANEIPAQRTQLDLMLKDLNTAESKFGPTAKWEKAANLVANRVLGFHPTMTREEIAALESFEKVGKQIAMTQAGNLHATDQTLQTALGANPNIDYSGLGDRGIIAMLHGNLDYAATKINEWNKQKQSWGANRYYDFSQEFNRSADPHVFQFMRMSKPEQAELLKVIDDKVAFERNLIEYDRRGWIKLPPEIKKALGK